jgi:hypothetical protein
LRNVPEGQRPQLHRSGSLKYHAKNEKKKYGGRRNFLCKGQKQTTGKYVQGAEGYKIYN